MLVSVCFHLKSIFIHRLSSNKQNILLTIFRILLIHFFVGCGVVQNTIKKLMFSCHKQLVFLYFYIMLVIYRNTIRYLNSCCYFCSQFINTIWLLVFFTSKTMGSQIIAFDRQFKFSNQILQCKEYNELLSSCKFQLFISILHLNINGGYRSIYAIRKPF